MNDSGGDEVTLRLVASGIRQVWFATAMRSNEYQGRLTQTLLQKSQIKIVIVTTG